MRICAYCGKSFEKKEKVFSQMMGHMRWCPGNPKKIKKSEEKK